MIFSLLCFSLLGKKNSFCIFDSFSSFTSRQKFGTFAGSSYLNVWICRLSLVLMIVTEESLGCGDLSFKGNFLIRLLTD